jgi:6-bladed beta-propeller
MRRIKLSLMLICCSCIFIFPQVKNPDQPLKGEWNYQMQKMWEVSKAGNEIFAQLRGIIISQEGSVFVQDSKSYKIHKFTKEGKHTASFGKRGEGPGEIMWMTQGFLKDKYFILPDEGKIHYFLTDGTYSKSTPVSVRLAPRFFVSENEFISAPLSYRVTSQKPLDITIYDLATQSRRDILKYVPYNQATSQSSTATGEKVTVSIVFHDITPIMVLGYRNKKIYYGMSDSYKIGIIDVQGKELGGFSLEGRNRIKVSKAFKKELASYLTHHPAAVVEKIIKGLPEKASYFYQVEIDKNGFIYVFRSNPEQKSTKAIDIFSPAGKYLYSSEIKAPESESIELISLRDTGLVMTVEDEEGEIRVIKYNIVTPRL